MHWHNEPPSWREDGDALVVTAAPRTDFWRRTHGSGERDNGHFFHQSVSGDFVARVLVRGEYKAQYDQAGLMVRLDETCWIKCGIEFVDGVQFASTVVTRDWSDWSMTPLANPTAVQFEVKRHGPTLEIRYSVDDAPSILMRQAFLTEAADVRVGIMIASPKGDGFTSRFTGFNIDAG